MSADQSRDPEYRRALAKSMRRKAAQLLDDALSLDPDVICSEPLGFQALYDQFVALRSILLDADVCLACGARTPGRTCHCENDE